MRKLVISLIVVMAAFVSCNNNEKENEINKQQQNEATMIAEQSTANISELPLNFNFGMTKQQVNNNLQELVSDDVVVKFGDIYEYDYILNSGKTIPTILRFGFYNDSLYTLVFSIDDNPFNDPPFTITESIIKEIDTNINNNLDSAYKRIFYYDLIKGNESNYKNLYTKWFKDNQYIFLRHVEGVHSDINYINATIDRIVSNKDTQRIIDKVKAKDGVTVKNSYLDGSVSQVKKYLEKTLKNPDSYESIEWSDVIENKDGYTVRHKYRAKNSFDGYIIENQVFYLDLRGNVINAIPYQ